MLNRRSKRRNYRAKLPIILFVLATLLLLTGLRFSAVVAQDTTSAKQIISDAWEKAQASGRYDFRTRVEQITYPLPKITNAGTQPDVQNLAMEGEVDLPAEQLSLTLWNDVSFNPDTGIAVRVEKGVAQARQGQGEWQEIDNIADLFAPGGDPMAFLAGMKNVTVGESRSVDLNGLTINGTQYLFDLDGPVLAEHLRARLERQLQEQGKLPAGVQLSSSEAYSDMVGSGEVWLNEAGLPIYSIFNLDFPAQGEEERVTAVITNNFFNYDLVQLGLATTPFLQSPTTWVAVRVSPEQAALTFAFAFFFVATILLIKTYWRTKAFYRFLASAIIFSMLFANLLRVDHVSAFMEEQLAHQEMTEAQRTEAEASDEIKAAQTTNWQPNQKAIPQLQAKVPTNIQRSVGPDTDGDGIVDQEELDYWETDPNNADSDGDGVDDGLEAYVLGTAPADSDSDDDNIVDGLEVTGFTYNAKDWFLDPLDSDSNKDGLSDGAECNVWVADHPAYDPTAACPDTDSDGTPDIFDVDNDGDGVPDDLDISPHSHGNQVFSKDNQFEFEIENLEVGQPVYVDLQMRPTDPNNISFVGSVLDWPTGDKDGQITRYLDTTWADTANLDLRLDTDNAANGDVRITPMLEMVIPSIDGHYGNLPVNSTYTGSDRPQGAVTQWLDTDLLDAYGVKVGDINNQGLQALYPDLLVYIPALVETDPDTGLGVALKARIPYWPEQGTTGDPTVVDWGNAHSVRLAWVVQMIGDQCIVAGEDPDTCAREDVLTTINMYDDTWHLTGMNISEEHGTDVAIVYEDPTIDTDLTLDDQLWVLSWNLNSTFLRGRDIDLNGERDVRVDNLETEISAWHNPSAGPLSLQVESFIGEFEHSDELHRIAMTDTISILDTAFAGYEAATNPTLLFAKETTNRSLSLDAISASSNLFTADFDPTLVLPTTIADMSWKPYEYVSGQWVTADALAYLETFDYHLSQSVFVETADLTQDEIDVVEGQRIWAQIYYATLYQGIGNVVAAGDEVVWSTSVEVDETFYNPSWPSSTFRGAAYIGQFFFLAFVNAVKGTINSIPGKLFTTQNFWKNFRTGFRTAVQDVFRTNFKDQTSLNAVGHFVDMLLILVTIVAAFGLIMLISGMARGDNKAIRTGVLILNITALVVHVVHFIVLFSALIALLVLINASVQVAAHILIRLSSFLTASKAFGWIGFIVTVVVAWGVFLYQWLGPGFDGNKVAKEVALSATVSSIIVALIYLLIDVVLALVLGPAAVIGVLLLLLLFIIDAILALEGKKTVTQRLTEAINETIFDIDFVLANFNSEDRLSFDISTLQLVDESLGLIEDNAFHLSLNITNTISYRKQSNASEADRSVFAYYLQRTPVDQHQDLQGNSMSDAWVKLGNSQLRMATTITTSQPISFSTPGLNQFMNVYLSEAYALPYQGCWAFAGLESNTCRWEFIKASTHVNIGEELLFDILPNTISGFMALDQWTDGEIVGTGDTLSVYFPTQIDQDNDGLINSKLGGVDPNDTDVDSDGDLVSDLVEISSGTNPLNPDTDGDGLTDSEESDWFTDPLDFDSDDDGLSDYIEVVEGWLTPTGVGNNVMRVWSSPHFTDLDGDNLSDLQEFTFGQHPGVPTDPDILANIVQIDRLEVNESSPSPWLLLEFDESALASTFLDSSGNDNTADCTLDSIHCPVSASEGRYGYGAAFTNDNIEVDVSDFDFAADFSLGFWIKTSNSNRSIAVLHNDNPGLDLPGEFFIETDVGVPALRQRLVTPSHGNIEATTAIDDGEWHHVMFVWDALAEAGTVFVDGVDDTNGPSSYENIVRDPAADSLAIGSQIFGPGFNGGFDDFVLYDRALSDVEVADVINGRFNLNDLIFQPGDGFTYEATITNTLLTQDVDGYLLGQSTHLTPAVEMPVVVLPFDADTYLTTFANDVTGESSSVTCVENANCPNLGFAGRYGNAAQFNNDSVTLPAISHDFSAQTIAFWIRPNSYPAAGQAETILDTEIEGLGALDITIDDSGHLVFDLGGSIYRYSYNCDSNGSCFGSDRGWLAAHRSFDPLSLNSWQHIVFNYQYQPEELGSVPLNTSMIFVDGLRDSVAWYSTIASPPTVTVGPGTLGNNVAGTSPIHARIDELVFYNDEAMTETESNINRISEIMAGNYYPGLDHSSGPSWPAYLIKFDDTITNRAVGLVNQVNDGQAAFCTGDACPVINSSGQIDDAVQFDGSNDYLAMNHVLNPAEESFTAMAWIQADTQNSIILQQEDGSGNGRVWLGLQGSNNLYTDLGNVVLASPQSLSTGQWYHVAVTYDGSTVKLYLDSQLVNQGARTAESSLGDMIIGANQNLGNRFDGLMDDLIIIPAVTDSDGIQAIMDHSYPAVNIDEPFVDFHMDEDINVSTDYYSALSRFDDPYWTTTYATNLPTSPCTGTSCPAFLDNSGAGASLLFDGTDDWLSYDQLSFADNEFTVGFWFKTDQTGVQQTMFAAADDTSPYNPGVLVEVTGAADVVRFLHRPVFGGTGGTNLLGSTVVTDGEWHFVTVTRERTDDFFTFNVTLYVDGVMEATAVDNTPLIDITAVTIGRFPPHQDRYFSGELDEMFISKSGVDAVGVAALMARTLPEGIEGTISGTGSIDDNAGPGFHRFDETVEAALQTQTTIPFPVVDDNASSLRVFAPFEEVPGVNHFENLISSEEDLTCSGDACPSAGLRGQIDRALFFDGLDDVLSGPDFGTTAATFAAWVKADGGTIIDMRRPNLISGLYLDFSGLHLSLRQDNGSNGDVTLLYDIPFTLPENEWVHVAAVFDDSDGRAYVYINGVQAGTVLTDLNDNPGNSLISEDPILGSNRFNTNVLNGYLDDVRIYNAALSAADILNLVNNSAPLLRFEFDEDDTAISFADLSINDYTGYPTLDTHFDSTLGYTVTVPSPIPGTDGQIGNTALFDGNGRIEVSSAPAIDSLTNEFAIMAWVNPDTISGTLQIVGHGRENSNDGFSLAIQDGNLIFMVNGNVQHISGATIQPNLWQHVAVVFDSANDARFYVDGQLEDTVSGSVPITANSDDPLFIGGATAAGSNALVEPFLGQIDELAIYGRELSDPEILSIYLRELRWYRTQDSNLFMVDTDNPSIQLLTDASYRPAGYTQLVVRTNDPSSYVTLLDVGIKAPGDSEFAWQGAIECTDAIRRGVAWCPAFDTSLLGGEGTYELQFRAVDVVGHETMSPVYQFFVDQTPPVASGSYNDTWLSADPVPSLDDTWAISLNGTVTDPPVGSVAGSGVLTNSVMVSLVNSTGEILDGAAQRATVSGNNWSIDYVSGGTKPFGTYTVTVSVEDEMGNIGTMAVGTILLDARPAQVDVNYWQLPGDVITESLTLSGTVSEQAFWGGALARYHFEEPAGSTTFYDNHIELEHATCTNCPVSTAGQFGQGLLFDGVDDMVDVPNLFNPISDTFSISLWFYADSSGSGGRALVQQDDGNGRGRTLLFLNSSNHLRTSLGFGSGTNFGGSTPVTADTWHHVAFTFDGTTGRLYLDGKLDGEGTPIAEAADGGLQLGSNRGNSAFFSGMMDEVTFYGTALSDYAVHALAQSNVYGVGDVNVGFELVDFAALTDTVTTTLTSNPLTWYTATLASPGEKLSLWNLSDNTPLENFYTIKLRSDDAAGNPSRMGTIWRGLIDRTPPRILASGQHLGGGSAAQTEYTFTFSDFLLDVDNLDQPCQDASLVSLTYNDPILPHDGQVYEVTATCRVPGHEIGRIFTACDSVGHCTDEAVEPNSSPPVSSVAILTPMHNVVISGTMLSVPVSGGAYDLDGIQTIAIRVNEQPLDTLTLGGATDTVWTAVDWQPTLSGTYTLTAVMTDSLNVSFSDSINVHVEIVNNGVTIANDDNATTAENTAVTIDVLANDMSGDGGVLTITTVTQGSNGSVVNNGSDVTYTPALDFNGSDVFTYTVSDGHGSTDTATVLVTVTAVNGLPTANDDNGMTAEDTAVAIDVLANDSDPDGDGLSVDSITQPLSGTAIISGTAILYTPAANFNGSDVFTYTVSDGNGGTDAGLVTILVTPVNDAPEANDDGVTTAEDTAVVIDVLANDSDVDGDGLIITAITQGNNGAVGQIDGTVIYTPALNFNGSDVFTYTISDSQGGTDIALVTVTVEAVNDNPVANDDGASTDADTAVVIDVLANDSDVELDTLTITSVTLGSNGNTVNHGTDVTYTPHSGFVGEDSFTYTISDGQGGSDTATVTVMVGMVNTAPVAEAGGPYTANEGDTVLVDASGSTDAEQDPTMLTYAWDLDNDGLYDDAVGITTTFSALTLDGPISATVGLQVTDGGGLMSVDTAVISVLNIPPTVMIEAVPELIYGEVATITVTASDPVDPLSYDFDCDGDGIYEVGPQAENSTVCSFANPGEFTVNVQVNDDDGGLTTDATQVTVISQQEALSNLRQEVQYLRDEGVLNRSQAQSLIKKLDRAIQQLDNGNPRAAIRRHLLPFVSQINDLILEGVLTPAQGQLLMDAANRIIAAIEMTD